MKLGTPGFQGARLRQARIALGLTQASLALMLGYKDAQVIGEFEAGKSTPQPDIFQRMSTITGQPAQFFLRPLPPNQKRSPVLFRSMRSLDEVAKARAEVMLLWLAEYARYLQGFVELPSLDLPTFSDIPKNPLQITDEHIRDAAGRLRKHWKLGRAPLPNLINLLESVGFVIHVASFDSHKWDAVSYWDADTRTPFILLNSDKPSYFRLRFNLLHELFHLLFHQDIDPELRESPAYQRMLEQQAHYFAGEMGLPYDAFPADLYAMNLDALRVTKLKWGMSIGAMIHRLHDLTLTNEREDRNLWANYARRKWRTEEPLDDAKGAEHPTVIHRIVKLLIEHQVLTTEDLRHGGLFSEAVQEQFARMGEEFWRPITPELKIHKMFG